MRSLPRFPQLGPDVAQPWHSVSSQPGTQLIVNTYVRQSREYTMKVRNFCTPLLCLEMRKTDKVRDRNNRMSLSIVSDDTKSIVYI